MAVIVVAALGVVAFVATLIARAADAALASGQTESVRIGLSESRAILAAAAERVASGIPASSVQPGAQGRGELDRRLSPDSAFSVRFERAYLIDGTGAVVAEYPAHTGAAKAPPNSVLSFVRRIRGTIDDKTGTIPAGSAAASGASAFLASTDFVSVGGMPMIAAAAATPAGDGAASDQDGVVVLLDSIDLSEVSLIGRLNGLEEMRFSESAPRAGEVGVPLSSTNSAVIGWLVWRQTRAVAMAFMQASPLFAALSLTLIVFAAAGGAMVDRSNRRLLERERLARHEAAHDALTGLANRGCFQEALTGELSQGGFVQASILYLDLDGFKEVNDTIGHHAGDVLLVSVAERLREAVAEQGMVARLGGDEFAVLLPMVGIDPAIGIARQIIRSIQRAMVVHGSTLSIGASVGIATAPIHGHEPYDLLRRADIALYAAKRRGRGQAVLFEAEMERNVQYRRFLDRDLRAALLVGEISLAYQPIFAADGERILGVEALLRWTSPTRGVVSPAEFIGIAEETGFITFLGAWALERACADARDWDLGFVSVNLSPVQMRSRDIIATVQRVLKKTGLDPHRLVLEITEGVLIEHSDEVLAVIQQIQAIGVAFALDDFGTGYSSLAYLKKFPFNKIKIDRTFVETLGTDSDAATIAHGIISLGRALGMTLVAEGVETREQHRFLRAAGCHELQGYLFARPMPASEIQVLLDQRPGLRLAARAS